MKPITANDIPARFRFILDMYGATDRFVRNRNNERIFNYYTHSWHSLISSIWWIKTPEGFNYWNAIRAQNEPEIFRLTKELEEKEKK